MRGSVEAEADSVTAARRADRVHSRRSAPAAEPSPVSACGVLDEQRDRHLQPVDALAPVVDDRRIVVLARCPPCTITPRAESAAAFNLLEELAARDPDPVVGGCDIEDVRRVHVEGDPRLFGGGFERGRATLIDDLRTLPGLRITQEELGQRCLAGDGLGDRIDLVAVPADGACVHVRKP